MMDKLLKILQHLTWKKYIIASLAAFTGIVAYTFYENRQGVYESQFPVMRGDYELNEPGKEGRQLLNDFMRRHPEIGLLTIIDADPISNRRLPIYRLYNSEAMRSIIEENYEQGRDGSGPLFSSDNVGNEQILAVLSGELKCEEVTQGMFTKLVPGAQQAAVYSCRIPIPPSYQYVTGWISIHFKTWPPGSSLDVLKQDALRLGLEYYRAEIGRQPIGGY